EGNDNLYLHAVALDQNNPRGGPPEHLWMRKITKAQKGPVHLAGVTFADIGDASLSIPLLFLTTREGDLHATNARPVDSNGTGPASRPTPTPRPAPRRRAGATASISYLWPLTRIRR